MKLTQTALTVLVGLVLLGNPSFSQDKLVLTLDQSIDLALTQNPFHLATEKREDTAQAQLREARAGFFPSLNAQGTATLDEKVFELEFPSFEPGQPPQRVEIDFTRDYQFSMQLNIPLFTSGRLTSGYKMANYNLRSTQEGTRLSRQMTVFNTKSAFYAVLLFKDYVKVANAALEDAEKLYNFVKLQHEVGLASQFDLLRSEVRMVNLKPQVIQAKNNLKIMELNLKTILGVDQNQAIELEGTLGFTPVELSLEALLERALENRPELEQVRYQKMMAGENLKLARSVGLPSLAISGQFSYWADKLKFTSNTWEDFYTVNLVLNIPIFNGLSTLARMGQAKAQIKEIEYNAKGVMDQVMFEVRQAVLKVEEAEETLLSQEKNVEQAEESQRIAELNFAEGLITVLDIGQAQTALTQARVNYSQALFDYVLALAEVDRATGVDNSGL
jgi:outer membrane protein TolC